jgi:DNA-binding XRE family transcriptional regulator
MTTVRRSTVGAAVAEVRQRLSITQVALARLIGVHPMTISRWERDELRVGPWHRQLLIALVSAQPRDNLEQRLSETSSNPVLVLAHLLSDSIAPNAAQRSPVVPPPPSPPPRLPASRQTTAVASRRLSGTALELAQAQAQPRPKHPTRARRISDPVFAARHRRLVEQTI